MFLDLILDVGNIVGDLEHVLDPAPSLRLPENIPRARGQQQLLLQPERALLVLGLVRVLEQDERGPEVDERVLTVPLLQKHAADVDATVLDGR